MTKLRKSMFQDAVNYGLYLDPETQKQLNDYVRTHASSKSKLVRRILESTISGVFEMPDDTTYTGTLANGEGRWVPYIIRFDRRKLEEIKEFAEANGFYNAQSFMRNAIRSHLNK